MVRYSPGSNNVQRLNPNGVIAFATTPDFDIGGQTARAIRVERATALFQP